MAKSSQYLEIAAAFVSSLAIGPIVGARRIPPTAQPGTVFIPMDDRDWTVETNDVAFERPGRVETTRKLLDDDSSEVGAEFPVASSPAHWANWAS